MAKGRAQTPPRMLPMEAAGKVPLRRIIEAGPTRMAHLGFPYGTSLCFPQTPFNPLLRQRINYPGRTGVRMVAVGLKGSGQESFPCRCRWELGWNGCGNGR